MAVARIAAIKQEFLEAQEESPEADSDPVQIRERILQLCRQHPKGVSDEMISKDQPQVDTHKRMTALQWLLGEVNQIIRGNQCFVLRLGLAITLFLHHRVVFCTHYHGNDSEEELIPLTLPVCSLCAFFYRKEQCDPCYSASGHVLWIYSVLYHLCVQVCLR